MDLSKKTLIATVAGTLAAGAVVVGSGQAQAGPEATDSTIVTGCAIRFTADGPKIHANSTHRCTGATSVSVNSSGELVITSRSRGAVVSVTAEEDETLSRKGIQAGSSGGIGTTRVRMYSRSGAFVRADSSTLKDPYANLWMTWVIQP